MFRRFILLFPLLLLAGCLNPAQYIRPDVPAGITWPTTENTSQPTPVDEWWRSFGDGGLNKLIPVVLAANNDLFAASLRARRALLDADSTKLNAIPQFNGTTSLSGSKQLQGQPSSRSVSSSLGLSYDLDLWGKLAAKRDMAAWEATATREDREAMRLTVIANTMTAWWQLAHTNQTIRSAESSLAVARRIQSIVNTKIAAETASDLEASQATYSINMQLAALESLKLQRDRQRVELAVLLNGANSPAPEPTRLPSSSLPPLQPGLPASLIGRRPDLRAGELRLRSALRNVDEKKASFYPSIPLTGSLGTSSRDLANFLANPVGSLGASTALPFLNVADMKLQIRVSEVQYEAAVTAFRGAMLTALSEVANGIAARQSYQRQAVHLARALATQRRVEALYETQFKEGSISLQPLLDAQERTRSAQTAVIDLALKRLLNEATLYRAFGGTPSPASSVMAP